MRNKQIVCNQPQSYAQPSIEVIMVEVESGFQLSQQAPSPWEDM